MPLPKKSRTIGLATITPEKETFLSRPELARRWGVHLETLKRLEKKGELQAVHFNERRLRYRLSDILKIEQEAGSK